jgi:lipoate-protein ligase A
MTLAARDWRLIREEAQPGPLNMALDETAAETAATGGPRTVRVYRWQPATLSLGYNQAPETVAWDHCAANDVSVVRRQTGGGGIYHDAVGDISYSIAVPRADLPGDLMDAYHVLLEPIIDAFDRMGVDARLVEAEHPPLHEPACYLRALHPAHDLVAGPDGRKISGNAQYRTRDAVVQHGSLSYACQPPTHLATFADPPVTPADFASRVTGIREEVGIERPAAVAALEDALDDWIGARAGGRRANEDGWTDAELADARALAREKYETDAWTRDRTDPTD